MIVKLTVQSNIWVSNKHADVASMDTCYLRPNLVAHLEFKFFPILIDHTADRCRYRPIVLTEPRGNRIKKTEKQILRVFLSTRLLICQLKKRVNGRRALSYPSV